MMCSFQFEFWFSFFGAAFHVVRRERTEVTVSETWLHQTDFVPVLTMFGRYARREWNSATSATSLPSLKSKM